MSSLGRLASSSIPVLLLATLAGCSGKEAAPPPLMGSGGTGAQGVGPGGPVTPGTPGQNGTQVLSLDGVVDCGNGVLQADNGEECDDGNSVGKDGCNQLCQIEADFVCPTPGAACVFSSVCGDGVLSSIEGCDDGNALDGDGCPATCAAVDAGWQCRVPGKKCIPLCGDGQIIGTENCDDGKPPASDDGCSSTCLTEPGWSCVGTECTRSQCGNGQQEAGESCDRGLENGLFFGDGTGCSKTCTTEPDCRSGEGCITPCGDGNIDPGEDCDDGNLFNADGCSNICTVEQGFDCVPQPNEDSEPCADGGGQCLVLPIIFRDFDGEHESGGHPDFFYLGENLNCVPNASGMAESWSSSTCGSTDSTDLCSGLVNDTLGPDGKPTLNTARGSTCQCRFTDWDQTGVISNGDPGVEQCTVEGDGSTRYRIEREVQVIESEASFQQWYHESDAAETVIKQIELAADRGNLYQFSSGDTVYDDLHAIFLGDATTLESGFFPLEDTGGATVCNIWPYWVADGDSTCAAGDGRDVPTQWDPQGSWDQNDQNGDGGPIPGSGTTTKQVRGLERNFYFTSEVRYLFRFAGQGEETLQFYGDDDVWVFINKRLVLDLGAPHERLQGSVTLTAGGDANWQIEAQAVGSSQWDEIESGSVSSLGLEVDRTYEIAVFHADRHPRESNYQLTVSGFSTNRSVCKPDCGDQVIAAGEECDDGDANAPDQYNGCTPDCKFGPFCGDGVVNGEELCDAGRDNRAVYGEGCTSDCKPAHFCGDGVVDTNFGEECDEGVSNGAGSMCTSACIVTIR